MTINVYLDSSAENIVPELALKATFLAEEWNGWATPVVTAEVFASFIGAWQRNDPNGTWQPDGVIEDTVNGTLAYVDNEHETNDFDIDVWQCVGTDSAGHRLYAIDGWCFIVA